MVSTDTELRDEVRSFAQYSTMEIDQDSLETAISRAKSHLRVESDLDIPDWYDPEFPEREEALFWTTLLFSKLSTADLDSKAVAVGGIDENELLAASDDDVTEWYRKYKRYRDLLIEENRTTSRTTKTSRTTIDGDRYYGR